MLPCPITGEELRHRYVECQDSMAEIARELRVSEYHVKKWLRRHGVPVRGRAEANRMRGNQPTNPAPGP